MSNDTVSWDELPEPDRRNFAMMLNNRFNAGVTVEEAAQYYGNPDAVERDFGEAATNGGPECPECFSPLFKTDIPHLKRTGCCPNCGEDITV